MRRLFMLLMASLWLLASCGNNVKTNGKENGEDSTKLNGSIKVMGAQVLYPMMVKWSAVFLEKNQDVRMIVRGTQSDIALQLLYKGETDVAMISRKLTKEETDKGLWCAPVAQDVLVPIISFDNNHIQPLVMKGISKEKLAGIFSGKTTKWGDIAGRKGDEPIQAYCLDDSSGTAGVWNDFLGLKLEENMATRVYTEKDIVRIVKNNKNAIGYCSMLSAYNTGNGVRQDGIYVIPVDYNSNNNIEDNEQYFDKLEIVQQAVMSGKIPAPPRRELYVVCMTKPQNPITIVFIEWILTIGQNYMPEMGYVHIPPERAKVAIESMK